MPNHGPRTTLSVLRFVAVWAALILGSWAVVGLIVLIALEIT